jgi:hypothetical protein
MHPDTDPSRVAAEHQPAKSSAELRALAAWYRDYAELAGNPMIWDYRLGTAEDLERQASDLERRRFKD